MILVSIAVRGFRCFASEVSVGPFDPGLNVLHAPNATGKSTLFTAVVRCLLDGHRVAGREVEEMRPWGRDLAPHVRVEYEHGTVGYRITKTFLVGPGSLLERKEGGEYVPLADGDRADALVREMISTARPGRGLARMEHWGIAQVLWAPQGDVRLPSLDGSLVTMIRESLGSQVQAPASTALEKRIDELHGIYFSPSGQPRRSESSAIVMLTAEIEEARIALAEAEQMADAFEGASRKVEELSRLRGLARAEVAEALRELDRARKRQKEHAEISSRQREVAERVKAAEARFAGARQRVEAAGKMHLEIDQVVEEKARLEHVMPSLERGLERLLADDARTRAAMEDAQRQVPVAAEALETAGRARRYVEGVEALRRLDDRLEKASATRAEIESLDAVQRGIAAPTSHEIRKVRRALEKADRLRSDLESAMVTLEIVPAKRSEIEVIAGEEPGARRLTRGRPLRVRGTPEVVVEMPGIGRIRALGRAQDAGDLHEEIRAADLELEELTRGFGTRDVEVLEARAEKASELASRIGALRERLEALEDGDPEAERTKLGRSQDEILSLHGWKEGLPDAAAMEGEAREAWSAASVRMAEAREEWRKAHEASVRASGEIRSAAERIEASSKRHARLLAELEALGIDEEVEKKAMEGLALALDEMRSALAALDEKVASFGEDPADDVARLEQRLAAAEQDQSRAFGQQREEEGRLRDLVDRAPHSALARAEERLEALESRLASETARRDAVRLLRETVEACRREAMDAVAGPVARAATRTLGRISGERMGRLVLGDGFEPTGIVPAHIDDQVPLTSLSGGEGEQVHLATRLALAEVIAKGERHLVVLDDVLAATDRGRLVRVMRVLEEASRNLQIVILTCHPERYRGLGGAAFHDLEEAIARGKARG